MLLRTDQPIAAIAAACGFSSQSHLTRVFQRHVGKTPAVYRAAVIGSAQRHGAFR
jgi:AraC family transcriptional regulator